MSPNTDPKCEFLHVARLSIYKQQHCAYLFLQIDELLWCVIFNAEYRSRALAAARLVVNRSSLWRQSEIGGIRGCVVTNELLSSEHRIAPRAELKTHHY
jgi:hypothetical protein